MVLQHHSFVPYGGTMYELILFRVCIDYVSHPIHADLTKAVSHLSQNSTIIYVLIPRRCQPDSPTIYSKGDMILTALQVEAVAVALAFKFATMTRTYHPRGGSIIINNMSCQSTVRNCVKPTRSLSINAITSKSQQVTVSKPPSNYIPPRNDSTPMFQSIQPLCAQQPRHLHAGRITCDNSSAGVSPSKNR